MFIYLVERRDYKMDGREMVGCFVRVEKQEGGEELMNFKFDSNKLPESL
jgi:hypothetical protein